MGAAQLRSCGKICWNDEQKSQATSGTNDAAPVSKQEFPHSPDDWVPPRGDCADGFGGKASICPTPPLKINSGPITLDTLQGQWQSGNGTQISVIGTVVHMNGVPLRNQRVELREDATVIGIGQRLQVDGWTPENSGIQFRANSADGQNMQFAPKEVWTRIDSAQSRDERLRLLGYAGTTASFEAGTRGVEGCIPGTLCQWRPASKDVEDVELLQTLISQWREPGLFKVCCSKVVPDFINREGTGIGVELLHYIAISIRDRGFQKRQDRSGHDIPVVVREPPGTDSHEEALLSWKKKVAEDPGCPPVHVREDEEMFTSLGNGHFFQALNLYACQCSAINETGRYDIGRDEPLRDAIIVGVPSIVLKSSTPRPVRAKVAITLNSKFDFRWNLNKDGSLDISKAEETSAYTPQFEAMSKHLDAVVVNSLVRTHLGIKRSSRIQG